MTDDDMKPTGEIFYSAKELFDHLNSLTISEPEAVEEPPLPPLAEGEYLHIESVQWNPVEDGGHYSNVADMAKTRDEAVSKLRELTASEDVFAVHVRRFPMREQGVHVYDERRLSASQSKAYMQRLRADKAVEAYDKAVEDKADLEQGYELIVSGLERQVEAQKRVIEKLMDNMRRTDSKLRRDLDDASYSEPTDILNLLFGVGIRPDERWERNMLSESMSQVRKEQQHEEAVELARRTGIWPLAPFIHGGNAQTRRCACMKAWHMDEVPPWHNGLECQKPTHEQAVAHARRTTVWPSAKPREGADPLSRFCACGKEWERGKVPRRHNGLECQPEACGTVHNGGQCAGEAGHEGDCSPHPRDFEKE